MDPLDLIETQSEALIWETNKFMFCDRQAKVSKTCNQKETKQEPVVNDSKASDRFQEQI